MPCPPINIRSKVKVRVLQELLILLQVLLHGLLVIIDVEKIMLIFTINAVITISHIKLIWAAGVSYAPLSSAPLVTVMCYCYLWCPTLLVLITLICNCVLLLQNSYFFCLCLLLVLPVGIWFADAEMLCYYKIETTQNRFGWFMTLAVTVAALVTLLSENRTQQSWM